MIMQILINPWQKKIVADNMTRIKSTVNSLLLMFFVIESARSISHLLVSMGAQDTSLKHLQTASISINKMPATKQRTI